MTVAVLEAMLDTSLVLVGLDRPTHFQGSGEIADTLASLRVVVSTASTKLDVFDLVAALTAAVKANSQRN
jgi:hypothetical protein